VTTTAAATYSILKKAREKIADPKRWAQGQFATDKDGGFVDPQSPHACRWCAYGAIMAVAGVGTTTLAMAALNSQVPRRRHVVVFNDSARTAHADILALFDRAIAALRPAKRGRAA
jgi:hypothetical protein